MTARPRTGLDTAPGRGRLAGRTVLVVGAGTDAHGGGAGVGNGTAIAMVCAREGATVICADRREPAAAATASAIIAAGGRAGSVSCDVTDESSCAAAIDQMVTGYGPVDGLVLNVGINVGKGLRGTSMREWDHVMATNLRGHFLTAKVAAERSALADGVALVSIGSGAGLIPGTLSPAYDASKAGLMGFVRHAAFELARTGGRANLVVPGLIDTPLGRAMGARRPSRDRVPVPLNRHGTPWEVAYAVLFLLSDEAAYITGQMLVVDGGLTWMR